MSSDFTTLQARLLSHSRALSEIAQEIAQYVPESATRDDSMDLAERSVWYAKRCLELASGEIGKALREIQRGKGA